MDFRGREPLLLLSGLCNFGFSFLFFLSFFDLFEEGSESRRSEMLDISDF